MKKSFLVLVTVFTAGIAVLAADNSLVRSGLKEVQAAKSQSQILWNEVTTPQQKERVRYINQKLAQAESYLQQSLSSPTNPPTYPPTNPPPQNQNVEFYRSDSCSSELVAVVNPMTDCSRYAGAERVWAIRVNGRCEDIDDTTTENACRIFQNAGDTTAVKVYKSDSCRDSLSGIFSTYTDCNTLSDSGNGAYAIMVGNKCTDISDMTLKKSCNAFKAISTPRAVKFYRSDSCSDELVAAVDRYTNCESLVGLDRVWAIETNGQCQDISDLDAVSACQRFKP